MFNHRQSHIEAFESLKTGKSSQQYYIFDKMKRTSVSI